MGEGVAWSRGRGDLGPLGKVDHPLAEKFISDWCQEIEATLPLRYTYLTIASLLGCGTKWEPRMAERKKSCDGRSWML